MKKYDIIEHTADVGLKAYGENLDEAFENAAKGMFDIITDKSKVEPKGEYRIDLEANELDQLLVDWLSELLYLFDAEGQVFGSFDVDLNEKKLSLSAKVLGEDFNTSKHKAGAEIKAVTYHMLEVKKEPCYVQVLFDI
ncbi:MAG: archease [Candidatus Thermoplasmatota archaeon]